MKFFAFIMALLVLTLGAVPCAVGIIDGKQKTKLANSQSQPYQEHNDACSPLCQCSCCAGFSISHAIASLSPIALFSLKPISRFFSSKSIEVAFSFWQPPRNC
jgi:hypothetical protein